MCLAVSPGSIGVPLPVRSIDVERCTWQADMTGREVEGPRLKEAGPRLEAG
jgi:hypothetical protein